MVSLRKSGMTAGLGEEGSVKEFRRPISTMAEPLGFVILQGKQIEKYWDKGT